MGISVKPIGALVYAIELAANFRKTGLLQYSLESIGVLVKENLKYSTF